MRSLHLSCLCRSKLLCTLTGALINKNEEAVWRHMMGNKFQRLLSKALRDHALLTMLWKMRHPAADDNSPLKLKAGLIA